MNIKKITVAVGAVALSFSISAGSFAYAADEAAAKPTPTATAAPDTVAPTTSPTPEKKPAEKSKSKKDFNLEDYAKKLGIDTTNMTEEQIKAAIKEERVQKAKEFLIEKGLYKEGMSEKEIFKKVREYYKANPK